MADVTARHRHRVSRRAMSRDVQIGGYTVAQSPNPPLAIAFVAFLVALIFSGTVEDLARAVLYVALAAWAHLELTEGVNAFRRTLGGLGLVLVVIAVARAIG